MAGSVSDMIYTERAPSPGGHYSQAVRAGNFLFISGQLPMPPSGGHPLVTAGFADQVAQALQNVLSVAAAAGASPNQIVKVTAYLADIEDWPTFNEVYSGLMGTVRSARTVVPTGPLHFGYRVEVDAIAIVA